MRVPFLIDVLLSQLQVGSGALGFRPGAMMLMLLTAVFELLAGREVFDHGNPFGSSLSIRHLPYAAFEAQPVAGLGSSMSFVVNRAAAILRADSFVHQVFEQGLSETMWDLLFVVVALLVIPTVFFLGLCLWHAVFDRARSKELIVVKGVRKSRPILSRCNAAVCKQKRMLLFAMIMLAQGTQATTEVLTDDAVVHAVSASASFVARSRVFVYVMLLASIGAILCMMQPFAASMRLPPRYDPSDPSQTFRTWSQDLMLWSISSELQPHQQAAMIISQLSGPARELARSITPQELFQGGVHNGNHLDPVSYLVQGLASRFAPLDDETRLRAAQDLLAFQRRQGETVDALITRFELTRSRARNDGGGAQVSVETGSLLLLRACGVTAEQFQALTQPFGFRLPSNDEQFNALCAHIRRLGHIIERQPLNIASTLRHNPMNQHGQQNPHFRRNAYFVGGEEASYAGDWSQVDGGDGGGWAPWETTDVQDWAFHVDPQYSAGADVSESSATSSDGNDPVDLSDLQNLTDAEVDQYLFEAYAGAKKRWRRFTGKPVRHLRRVLKRKGKGKGKKGAYLNIPQILQESAFFKGKGKGAYTSGKGFGRRGNPRDRNGVQMRCLVCGSTWHLQAKCPQRNPNASASGGAPAPSGSGQINSGAQRHMYAEQLHFATYEVPPDAPTREDDDASWFRVSYGARSVEPSEQQTPSRAASRVADEAEVQDTPRHRGGEPEHVRLTPNFPSGEEEDPLWVNDPWMSWHHNLSQSSQAPFEQTPGMHTPFGSSQTSPMFAMPDMRFNVSSSHQMPQVAASSNAMPSSFVMNAAQNNSWNMPYAVPGTMPSMPFVSQVNMSMPSSAASIPEVSAITNATQMPVSSATRESSSPSFVPAWFMNSGTQSSAYASQISSVPNPAQQQSTTDTAVNQLTSVFSEIHAHSRSVSRGSRSEPSQQEEGRARVFSNTCTICLTAFEQGDDVLRVSCDHVFHALCFSELMQHSAEDGVQCPNCRAPCTAVSTWLYMIPLASTANVGTATASAEDPEQANAVNTPVPTEDGWDSEEEPFHSPQPSPHEDEEEDGGRPRQSFAWWPVPRHRSGPHAGEPVAEATYHSQVRLRQGMGLLIDPGSYGNLVGSEWLADAREIVHNHSKEILTQSRRNPMHVGGIGKGHQTCIRDCLVPLALRRSDGTMQEADYAAPVVEESSAPALLGLRSLKRHNAILDMSRNMLHLLPDDTQAELVLPTGAESFPLEQSESGHLLLPFTDFVGLRQSRFERPNPRLVHLFADDANAESMAAVQIETRSKAVAPSAKEGSSSPAKAKASEPNAPAAASAASSASTVPRVVIPQITPKGEPRPAKPAASAGPKATPRGSVGTAIAAGPKPPAHPRETGDQDEE